MRGEHLEAKAKTQRLSISVLNDIVVGRETREGVGFGVEGEEGRWWVLYRGKIKLKKDFSGKFN